MNKIVVFANQKGGVGKSTICTLFANYLCWKKKKVCIIDTDLQQTVAQMRKSDLDFYGSEAPYSIQAFPVADIETMGKISNTFSKKFANIRIIIYLCTVLRSTLVHM